MSCIANSLKISVRVNKLNLPYEVAEGLVASARSMAYRGIATPKRDFDHDDIQRERDSIVFDTPAPESLVSNRAANAYQDIAFLSWLASDYLDLFKFVGL